MPISNDVRGLLHLSGRKQQELAAYFDMSVQTMSNKFRRNSWSGTDLARVAAFCGCELSFILPNGQKIVIGQDTDQSEN